MTVRQDLIAAVWVLVALTTATGLLLGAGLVIRAAVIRAARREKRREARKRHPSLPDHPDFDCEPLTSRERAEVDAMELSLGQFEAQGDGSNRAVKWIKEK